MTRVHRVILGVSLFAVVGCTSEAEKAAEQARQRLELEQQDAAREARVAFFKFGSAGCPGFQRGLGTNIAVCGPERDGWVPRRVYPKRGSAAHRQLLDDCGEIARRRGYTRRVIKGHAADIYGPPLTPELADPDHVADELVYCTR